MRLYKNLRELVLKFVKILRFYFDGNLKNSIVIIIFNLCYV